MSKDRVSKSRATQKLRKAPQLYWLENTVDMKGCKFCSNMTVVCIKSQPVCTNCGEEQ